MLNVALLDVQAAAWGPLLELAEMERQHGSSWAIARAMQARRRVIVSILSLPETTQIVERTADGIRVVS